MGLDWQFYLAYPYPDKSALCAKSRANRSNHLVVSPDVLINLNNFDLLNPPPPQAPGHTGPFLFGRLYPF